MAYFGPQCVFIFLLVYLFKQKIEMRFNNTWLLSICALVTLTISILTIIATAGSIANYKPINNVYMNQANISHINITKIIPQTASLLETLGLAINAPNASYNEIFKTLGNISSTQALSPLLTLFINSKNLRESFFTLEKLIPIAMHEESSSKAQLLDIHDLLENSNNQTSTLDSLFILLSNIAQADFTKSTSTLAINQSTSLMSSHDKNTMMEKDFDFSVLASSSDSSNFNITLLDANSTFKEIEDNRSPLIQSLVAPNNVSFTSSLIALSELLLVSKNSSRTLQLLSDIESSRANETQNQATLLFQLLRNSNNPVETFDAILKLALFAQTNSSVFDSISILLDSIVKAKPLDKTDIQKMTPYILEYFNIATIYRMGIFSLCRGNLDGKILSCRHSKPVQNLNIRSILYDELIQSDFQPYMRALNITADMLHLNGKLLDREHEYLPAVNAILAFNLLTIIFGVLLSLLIISSMLGFYHIFLLNKILIVLISIFTILGALIVTVLTQILKSGTKDDNYGMVITAGSAYFGLVWTAFGLSFILMIVTWIIPIIRSYNHPPLTESDPENCSKELNLEKIPSNICEVDEGSSVSEN